ncbi:carbohydrate-binding protein [Flavobacterium sufflavum]|uniref:Carbohydrate-binding protein n=1 Tax=Flavobacterium sufflavum TaxID=1921138 RepID=A0A437L2W1_9FLAO|nr:family 43 glycosylhydrolase [Flavobacterium sufflavum]RVT79636.1 carbohydrate-binding protein [Flavobacterium sufflavum]
MKNILSNLLFILFMCCSLQINAQHINKQTTVCNPINLNYRFQLNNPSRREAADPAVVLFKGKYFLFASKSGGYWTSDNLIDWKFITTSDLPLEDYAPTAVVMNDAVYFMALDRRIYKSAEPLSGKWQIVKENFPIVVNDPCLFLDDDGRLYLYQGLSNNKPIYGVELNKETFDPIGSQSELLSSNTINNGWERPSDYNDYSGRRKPFLEGPWITKHKGKYYLQYSAPGTEYKSYSDGLYIANSPLGPFQLAENNPFSYKPEGFICGAGHGTTFQDKWSNYWYMGTMTISVKDHFERRLGLFPAFLDEDGTFYAYTAFGDFPHVLPKKHIKEPEDYKPSGMLLSYKKPVEVSSTLDSHPKENTTNEDVRSYWSAKTGNKGEWILVDLQKQSKINAVQINFFDEATTILGRTNSIYYQYLLEYSNDKKSWKTISDKRTNTTDVPHDFIELKAPVSARYIRLTNYHVPDGKFAISGLRIFGKGNGKLSQNVSSFTAVRDTTDKRNVILTWQKSEDATGYNIRYGTAPDKLYMNYQVFNADSLTIHSLNAQQKYFFTIDTFNENGITKGIKVIEAQND